MNFFKRNLVFFLKKENMLKSIFISLNSLNLYFFMDKKKCIINTFILFTIYFYISDTNKNDKIKLFLIWLIFSILTISGESLIISKTKGKQIKYNKADVFNVNSWLFTAYGSMVFTVILLNDYFNYIL